MKKEYVAPELEIVEFDTLDVITTSGDGDIELPDQEFGLSEIIFETDLD